MQTKKNMLIMSMIGILIAVVFSFTHASADSITFLGFQPGDTIGSKFSPVHYTFGENNYQGGIFWLPNIEVKPSETLTYPGAVDPNKTRVCRKQIRGLYYNGKRGDRLRPLDQISLGYLKSINSNYANLGIVGGWYTTCSGGVEDLTGTAIYGQITYTDGLNGAQKSTLTAGLMYKTDNTISTTQVGFYPSLAYYNNETPIGYLFDSYGGTTAGDIGFIGGLFSGHAAILGSLTGNKGINDLFIGSSNSKVCSQLEQQYCITTGLNAGLDTAWYLSILGNTLLSRGGLDIINRQSVIGNIGSTSAIIFSDLINTSDVLNELRRNANNLCAGKVREENIPLDGAPVVCIKKDIDETPLVIVMDDPDFYNGRDIIVKGRDVILDKYMDPINGLPTLNIFIDGGNLYLRPDTSYFNKTNAGQYWTFNKSGTINSLQWATNNGGNSGYAYGQLLRGNIFVNGIIAGFSGNINDLSNYGPTYIPNKYYVYGRLASLNTALTPSLGRIDMINSLFSSNGEYDNYINLSNVFTWSCGIGNNATGSDTMPCSLTGDVFKNSSFILIKDYFPTNLLQ